MNYVQDYLYHHGILGQKWGKKNGPPYPLNKSDYSTSERNARFRQQLKEINSKHHGGGGGSVEEEDEEEKEKRELLEEFAEYFVNQRDPKKREELLKKYQALLAEKGAKFSPDQMIRMASDMKKETLQRQAKAKKAVEPIEKAKPAGKAFVDIHKDLLGIDDLEKSIQIYRVAGKSRRFKAIDKLRKDDIKRQKEEFKKSQNPAYYEYKRREAEFNKQNQKQEAARQKAQQREIERVRKETADRVDEFRRTRSSDASDPKRYESNKKALQETADLIRAYKNLSGTAPKELYELEEKYTKAVDLYEKNHKK